MTSPALSERTRRILAALIREYIETGEPVASAALTRRAGPGPVVRHDSQRPGAARGDGLRVAAPHVGGPRAHRPRLSLLRRFAARRPSAPARTPPASKRACGSRPATRRSSTICCPAHRTCCPKSLGTSDSPSRQPTRRRIFQRIEFVPLSGQPHPGGRGDARQPDVPEDRRHRVRPSIARSSSRQRTTSTTSSPGGRWTTCAKAS